MLDHHRVRMSEVVLCTILPDITFSAEWTLDWPLGADVLRVLQCLVTLVLLDLLCRSCHLKVEVQPAVRSAMLSPR